MELNDVWRTGCAPKEGMKFDATDSDALKSFYEKFSQARGHIKVLNPINGCVAGAKWDDAPLSEDNIRKCDVAEREIRSGAKQAFIKSGIVYTMDLFEGYVHDIFTEAFTYTLWDGTLLKDMRMALARQECEESWPAVTKLVIKMASICEDKDDEEREFDIIRNHDVWLNLIRKHRDDTLRDLRPTITKMKTTLKHLFALDDTTINLLPVPKEDHSWSSPTTRGRPNDKTYATNEAHVEQRSSAKKNAEFTPSAKGAYYSCRLEEFPLEIMLKYELFVGLWVVSEKDETFIIKDMDALTYILDLFYAIRCIYVHGKSQPTVDDVLKNFPRGEKRTLKLENPAVEEYIFKIYDDIRGNRLTVDYLLFLNFSRFILNVALCLQRALGYFIYYQLKFDRMYPSFFPYRQTFWGLAESEGIVDSPKRPRTKASRRTITRN